MAELARRAPLAVYLAPFRSPWTCDTVHTAQREVTAAGLVDVRVRLERRQARPADVLAFLATSVAVTELDRLPATCAARTPLRSSRRCSHPQNSPTSAST